MVLPKGVNDFQLTKNFNLREFMSPDTCEVMIYPELVDKLQDLRDYLDKPIKVTSGYRTPERNKAVGGVEGSYHLIGKAVDILVDSPEDVVRKYANLSGFSYCKYYPNTKHFHLDIGKIRM